MCKISLTEVLTSDLWFVTSIKRTVNHRVKVVAKHIAGLTYNKDHKDAYVDELVKTNLGVSLINLSVFKTYDNI